MKKYFLFSILTLISVMAASGQIKDKAIENMMSERMLTLEDVSYNTALLLPRLYRENKQDTIKAIIDYFEKNYGTRRGTGSTITPFIIITKIKNKEFKETIESKRVMEYDPEYGVETDSQRYESNIFPCMNWYLDNYNIGNNLNYPEYIRKAYGGYMDFLRLLADEELKKPGHTPVEQFLLAFFAHPSADMYKELEQSQYDGTLLQKVYRKLKKENNAVSGLNLGATAGAWIPTGNLSIVGSHPYIGYVVGGRNEKWMFDLALNFSFLNSPNSYLITVDGVTYPTSYYLGYYIGMDGGYEIVRHNRHEFDLLAGLAMAGLNSLSSNSPYYNTNNSNSDAGQLFSVNLNAGLGYRFYISHKTKHGDDRRHYIALQAKYNYLHFNNYNGTNLFGDAWTLGLIYGGYSGKTHHHDYISSNGRH